MTWIGGYHLQLRHLALHAEHVSHQLPSCIHLLEKTMRKLMFSEEIPDMTIQGYILFDLLTPRKQNLDLQTNM